MNRPRTVPAGARLADTILMTGCVISLLVCAYFVYFYYWTGTRQFTSPLGPYLYYGAPIFLGLLLFAALRLHPSRRVNVALVLCSAGVGIYSLEILATLWFNLPFVIESGDRTFRSNLAKAEGLEFDTRSQAEVIDDFRSRGMDAVPSMFPQGLVEKQQDGTMEPAISIEGTPVLPLGGIANKLTVVCNEGGRFLTYTSDEHGFNNPHGLWNSPPLSVLAVGDSFTHGFCVGPDDNFVAQIRKRYPASLSIGIEGDGPLTMLAALKEYGGITKPKVVLWFYFEGNDIADLNTESHSPLLNRYLTGGFTQNLPARQPEIDAALTSYIENVKSKGEMARTLHQLWDHVKGFGQPDALEDIIKLSELRKRLSLIQGTQVRSAAKIDSTTLIDHRALEPRNVALMNLLNQILLEAKKSVSEWGGHLYFVYLPSWDRYAPTGNGPNPDRSSVLQVVERAGLPLIDIHEAFAARPDPLTLFPLRIGHHYNEEGHRLVAEEVLRSVTVNK